MKTEICIVLFAVGACLAYHPDCVDEHGNPITSPVFGREGVCDKFYQCVYGELKELECAEGLAFDPSLGVCNFANNVQGCEYIDGIDESETLCRDLEGNAISKPPFRKPGTCDTFYQCDNGMLSETSCPPGLVFNPVKGYCDWETNSPPCIPGTTTTTLKPSTPSSTADSTTTSSTTSATSSKHPPTEDPLCKDEAGKPISTDVFAKEGECEKFFQCSYGLITVGECPEKHAFHPEALTCMPANQVPGCETDPEASRCHDEEGRPVTTERFPKPSSCTVYFYCQSGLLQEVDCADKGLVFNPETQKCTSKSDSPECVPETTTATTKKPGSSETTTTKTDESSSTTKSFVSTTTLSLITSASTHSHLVTTTITDTLTSTSVQDTSTSDSHSLSPGTTTTKVPPANTGSTTIKVPPANTGSTTTSIPPVNTGSTTTSVPPANTGATTTKVPPANTGATTTSVPPANTGATTTKVPPANTGSTITSVPPANTGSTTTSVPPANTGSTTTSVPPANTGSTTTSIPPVNTGSTTTSVPPANTGATTTKVPPANTGATTTSVPPANTGATTTKVPPANTGSTTTSVPPANTGSTTTSVPPANTGSTTTSVPPANTGSTTTSIPPVNTGSTTTSVPPANTGATTTKVPPANTGSTTTSVPPANTGSTTTKVPPANTGSTTTSVPPANTGSTTTKVPPANTGSTTTKVPPANTGSTTTKVPPVNTGSTATSVPPANTGSTTTSVPPANTGSTTTSVPPANTGSTTTKVPPANTGSTTTSVPPVNTGSTATSVPPANTGSTTTSVPPANTGSTTTSVPPANTGSTTTKVPPANTGSTTTSVPPAITGSTTTSVPPANTGATTTKVPPANTGSTTTKVSPAGTTQDTATTTSTSLPKGDTFVAFVVDDTGSMSNEITAVKEWMTTCIHGGYDSCANAPTGGWLVTSFNDPGVGPVIGPTTDLNEAIKAVDDLYAHGGGDCPEYAFTALQNLANTIPDDNAGCKVFFFSDAVSKDSSKSGATFDLYVKKRCVFIPMLTGCCGTCEDPCISTDPEYCTSFVTDGRGSTRRKRTVATDYLSGPPERMYYQLASETGGNIFLTDKPSSPDELLDFLEEEVTLGFCPTSLIAGPPPLGYTNENDCNLTHSCWDRSVGKCYCVSETEPCPKDPIAIATTTNVPPATTSSTTKEPPASTASPTTNEPPATTSSTTTKEPPASTASPTTNEPPATTSSTTTKEPPATTGSPTTNEPPATTSSTTTNEPPATISSTTTKEPPATTGSPTTNEPPSTTSSTMTKEPPVNTDSTTISVPPANTELATTAIQHASSTQHTGTTTSTSLPKGDTFVAFVVDDTGSMSNEITAVKEWMTTCIHGGYDSCAYAPTGGWLVTSFNDPGAGPVIGPTTDLNEAIKAVDDLYAHGGGDCPEYAFTALQNVANTIPDVNAGCKVFFFSDAIGKDSSKSGATFELYVKKRCVFIPMLTGCCGTCEDPCISTDPEYCTNFVTDGRGSTRRKRTVATDYSSNPLERMYYQLASETGGNIFLTDKPSSPDELLDFLEEEVTLGFCPTSLIAGPPPLGYTSENDCNLTHSCWDRSVGKCYCVSETEPCPKDPIAPSCPKDGKNALMPDPTDCTKYYECLAERIWRRDCAPGTVFDPIVGVCNHPENTAPPCGSKVTS